MNKDFDVTDFNSCVNRGLFLLNNRKEQMEKEGYRFMTCLHAAKWAIEQRIINRASNTTMMSAVIEYVEMVENKEEKRVFNEWKIGVIEKMSTTQKRITIALTKQDLRELDALSQYLGENHSGVIRRAVILLNYITFKTKDDDNEQRQ